jgi:hypothetical protein
MMKKNAAWTLGIVTMKKRSRKSDHIVFRSLGHGCVSLEMATPFSQPPLITTDRTHRDFSLARRLHMAWQQ